MKKLSTYLFLILFSVQTSSLGSNISDFQVEGISIGDSLLDYMSEEEIKNNVVHVYEDKKFTISEYKKSFELYDALGFAYKTDDKKYMVQGMQGQIEFKDDTGKEVKPVNFGSGKTNQQRVKSIEVYLTVRSANEIFKKNKNWKINNADQNYSKNDRYTRETFFVSVYPRNIVKN